ncbi:MAG: Lrp/AsnC family transcriptional regulator, partial [Chthoniobacterales bacterium]|nr:Lrp/AsnC family transcriptional regulator [Chthoniobacterales bacterium]
MSVAAGIQIPTSHLDPVNAKILAISEDQIQGFKPEPFRVISELSGVPLEELLLRLRAMLEAGTIRRIRQTLITTSLAEGALVAWQIPENRLDFAFDFLLREDPFSGHIVIRSTDAQIPGASYKLWTTLKVPVGLSIEEHCRILQHFISATAFRIMPARGIFVLGVGHTRRRRLKPGDKAPKPAQMTPVQTIRLTDEQWRLLSVLKREFASDEIREPAWAGRAEELGLPLNKFYSEVEKLNNLGILGRFST